LKAEINCASAASNKSDTLRHSYRIFEGYYSVNHNKSNAAYLNSKLACHGADKSELAQIVPGHLTLEVPKVEAP
jgi:hypothetical protein